MNNVIKCKNIRYSYHDGDRETPILSNLNFEVSQGESIAILGQSGCGKSTLLNLIGGIDKPSSGEVYIGNNDLATLNEEKITELRAKSLGFVYQFHHLLKDFSAIENIAMPLLIQGINKETCIKKASQITKTIGLEHRENHLPSELSGGERQRVAIARAIISNPSCLLADEPTGNLDAKNASSVLELLINLNQQHGSSLIIVTHDEKIATKMDRVLVLEGGHLKAA
ncbi:MAG TPA: lipoprotein-releasing system ATP-binding protein LolD [Gammaproteobacteria bacterium]|jgi:lipoprotein-releasing system ATP-binding protein|nr:ABC transporter ATP-binding protein [Gammaproteobacteria bacterium]HAY41443.1 lipoprotein-releasing system ATP-binding protein LolD [Gammaproteobacteria bacterium]|tara:strand:- start:8222 stop:8899 length:678 start_codon:yes stop_codon:yes gene_type:complete